MKFSSNQFDLSSPICLQMDGNLSVILGDSDMTKEDGVNLDKFIVLRRGYGDVHDIGYGWTKEDLLALSTALTWNSGSVEHDIAWREVERRAKKRVRRLATVKPC